MGFPIETSRYALKRIMGYVVLFATVGFCFVNFKTGPCTPNLDIVSYLVAGIICLFLLLKNLIRLMFFRNRTNGYSVLIHLFATLVLCVMGSI